METESASAHKGSNRCGKTDNGLWKTKKEKCRINRKLFPLKAFYFMSVSATACLAPYIVVYTKQQGLSTEESGILFGVMPFLAFLVQPIIGMIADRWKKHKAILMLTTVITGVFNILITTAPARPRNDVIVGDAILTCSPHFGLAMTYCGDGVSVDRDRTGDGYVCKSNADVKSHVSSKTSNDTLGCNVRENIERDRLSCPQTLGGVLHQMHSQENNSKDLSFFFSCHVSCPNPTQKKNIAESVCFTNNTHTTLKSYIERCNAYKNGGFPETFTILGLKNQSTIFPPITANNSMIHHVKEQTHRCNNSFQVSSLAVNDKAFETVLCEPKQELHCEIECRLPPGGLCQVNASFFDLTFWLLFLFYFVGFLAFCPIAPMTDAICYCLLRDEWRNYGRQRMWGTVGWLLVSMATSVGVYLNQDLDYTFMFYFYGTFMGVSSLIAYSIDIPTGIRCGNILKNTCKVLALPKVLALLTMAFTYGLTFGSLGFILWYLEDLGAPPQIFGPFNVVGVLMEIPTFFIVGRLIRRFGPVPCICVSMTCQSLRLLAYSLLGNPWLVLLIEPLHGVVVGLMVGPATTYISWISPPGMTATSQGLLGATMLSLGRAVGLILTGWLFKMVGARVTFATYAGLVLTVTALFAFLNRFVFSPTLPPAIDKEMKETVAASDMDTQVALMKPLPGSPEDERTAVDMAAARA